MVDPRRKGDGARRATYEDVLAAPEHQVAEIIDGELLLSARPAPRHATTSSALGGVLFDFVGPEGEGGNRGDGPGGWVILDEPELHLRDDIVVPDLAAWRAERLPQLPEAAYFELAPDWVCEVLSPSSVRVDRIRKSRIYARQGVRHLWVIDPLEHSVEVYRLFEDDEGTRGWLSVGGYVDDETVHAEPFDALPLPLKRLWG